MWRATVRLAPSCSRHCHPAAGTAAGRLTACFSLWFLLGSLCHFSPQSLQENIYRNFGMPQPNGYRKALRFMRHADKFGFPIVTFVDTPGAYAGKNAEELGQVR